VAAVFIAGSAAAVAAGEPGKKKAKGQRPTVTTGAAGQASATRAAGARPLAIDSDASSGIYCAASTPVVHSLGTVPAGFAAIIDFESDDTSDPIAILTTLKIDGTDVGAELASSDDQGGDLNPRFELRRPYTATYVLTVGSADDDEACYTFRVRIQP
jgi:hypothetical protein